MTSSLTRSAFITVALIGACDERTNLKSSEVPEASEPEEPSGAAGASRSLEGAADSPAQALGGMAGTAAEGSSVAEAGGTSGAASTSTNNRCAGTGANCPTSCATVPVVQGCGPAAHRESLCTDMAPVIEAPACGVQLESGEIFRLDFERPVPNMGWENVKNPFGSIPGFRACTANEISASDCWPPAQSAAQKVTILVTNESGADRFLLVAGEGCTPIAIERSPAWTPLVLGVDTGYCACPPVACDPTTRRNFVQLASGASYSIEWDAREMLLVEKIVSCTTNLDEHEPYGIPARVSGGSYRVTIGLDLVGPTVRAGENGSYFHFPRVQPFCKAPVTLTAEFVLPETGDIVVPISIPEQPL